MRPLKRVKDARNKPLNLVRPRKNLQHSRVAAPLRPPRRPPVLHQPRPRHQRLRKRPHRRVLLARPHRLKKAGKDAQKMAVKVHKPPLHQPLKRPKQVQKPLIVTRRQRLAPKLLQRRPVPKLLRQVPPNLKQLHPDAARLFLPNPLKQHKPDRLV